MVRFSYKDYRDDREKIMALHYAEFIRRFLMHVLPKGFMRIRHYRLLANRCRAQPLKTIRNILATPVPPKAETSNQELVTYPCPKCRQGGLIFKHKITPLKLWGHPLPG